MRYWFLLTLVILILGMGFVLPNEEQPPSRIPFLNEEGSWADSVLSTLSMEEKLGQLLFYQGTPSSSRERIQLYNSIGQGRLGGLQMSDMPVNTYLNFIDSCQMLSAVPLMIGTAEQSLLNNQFSDLVHLPDSRLVRQMVNDSLLGAIDQLFVQQAKALGVNWRQSNKNLSAATIYKFNQNGILNFEMMLKEDVSDDDPVAWTLSSSFTRPATQLIKAGLSGLYISSGVYTKKLEAQQFQEKIRTEMGFNGLMLTDWDNDQLNRQLKSGVDLFLVNSNYREALFSLRRAYQDGIITETSLNQRVRRVLLAKHWSTKNQESLQNTKAPSLLALQASVHPFQTPSSDQIKTLDRSALEKHFTSSKWELFRHRLYESSIILANNPGSNIPFIKPQRFKIWEFSEETLNNFRSSFKKYADFTLDRRASMPESLPKVDLDPKRSHIIILDQYQLDPQKDADFIESLQNRPRGSQVVVINYGSLANLSQLPASVGVVQIYERNDITESLGAQLLFGAFQPEGQLPEEWKRQLAFSAAYASPIRLKYGIPQEVGIDPARLVGLDAIARQAIQDGVMPGCQVLVAKQGKVIYNKTFGYHTYRKKKPVGAEDLYDLASITKVSATTLALMQLYEKKKINLNDPLKKVLSLPESSSLGSISLKQLMTHQSGLQIYMPVAPYLLFRDQPNTNCDSFFCHNPTDTFAVQIADQFYFKKEYQDKIWKDVCELPVYRRKRTRYSDVNFYLLQKVVEEQSAQRLDQLLEKDFYRPLGLRHMTFKPAQKFDKKSLIPTEHDKRWRQQLVQGYVHDETAALLGGVAGHAGLFSTAEDLAVVFQMLLNGGKYGGKQYLSENTIKLFTSRQYGTFRGLGFDKPSARNHSARAASASDNTFGHTGFTGTCVWADPKEELIFVFLSNRVHPVARNPLLNRLEVRRRMHQVVYDALDSYTDEELVF